VEIVRGGTAPLFANNAPGGVANFITNHGTATSVGAFRVTTGSDGLLRGDLTESGPVAPNLQMSVSGYVHTDNGLRDPGFSNGDLGGQIKIGATYILPKGKLFGDIKFLDDKDIFYTDIPIANPVTGASLGGLINPNTGTLDSAAFQHVDLRVLNVGGGNSSLARNLSDGLHPTTETVTLGGDYDVGAGLIFSDKARYTQGTIDDSAIFNGQYVTGGASGFSAQAYANGLVKSVPGAASAQYVIAGANTVVSPAQDLALANTWTSVRTEFSDVINDARFDGKLNDGMLGRHDYSAGVYFSHYTFSQYRLVGTFLTDVKNNPDLLNVQAVSASGAVLGNVTDNGFTTYGNGASGSVEGNAAAFYASDDWHVTDDWQVDVGARREVEWENGLKGVLTTQSLALPGVIVPIKVSGATSYVPESETLNGTAWTAGSSYQLGKPINVFVRYTSSYAFPRFQNIYAGANFGGKPLPVSNIEQAEGGVKLNWPGLSIFAVGFYSHFDPLISSILVQNTAGNLVSQSVSAQTTASGAEVEGAWSPMLHFDVHGDLTLQDTSVDNVIAPGYSTAGTNGKREPRVPNLLASIEPAYHFEYGSAQGRVFATFSYIGERFQDYNNLSRLPAYETIDAGATADYRNLTFGVHGLNLTDSAGLTEGNARASALALTSSTPVVNSTIGRPIFGRGFTVDLTVHW
jgi:outer membrane receptor protein involved in Fe transport